MNIEYHQELAFQHICSFFKAATFTLRPFFKSGKQSFPIIASCRQSLESTLSTLSVIFVKFMVDSEALFSEDNGDDDVGDQDDDDDVGDQDDHEDDVGDQDDHEDDLLQQCQSASYHLSVW